MEVVTDAPTPRTLGQLRESGHVQTLAARSGATCTAPVPMSACELKAGVREKEPEFPILTLAV